MPEIIVESTPGPVTITDDSSSSALRAAARAATSGETDKTPTPEPEAEPVAAAPVEEKAPEPESGTDEKKPEPEEAEPELPEGVKKRIAKEAERQARIQSEIDRAVSARKAKEEELKKLSGSEPAPTPEKQLPAGRPVRPQPDAYQTWGEYLAADAKYATEHEAWLVEETRKTVTQEITANRQAEEGKRLWDSAVKDHADLPTMAPQVVEHSPEGLQLAISALDNWAGVTVHLGKNPEELAALVEAFNANPYRGVTELGKLEERLKPATKQAATSTATKPLPAPLKPVGGGASATTPKVDMENAPFHVFKSEVKRMLKAG